MRSLSVVKTTVLVLGIATSAMAVGTFTNPTSVNLLERWLPNGTYGLPISYTGSTIGPGNGASNAEIMKPFEAWSYYASAGTQIARFTFPQPVVLGKVMAQFRAADHEPDTYTIRDQTGDIVADTPPSVYGSPIYATVGAGRAPSTYIEFVGKTAGGYWDVPRIGAYLAAGQSLAFDDGTYNIFYQEVEGGGMTRTGGDAQWTDKLTTMAGAAASGNVTYQLSQAYSFLGAYISHYGNSAGQTGVSFQVSKDGVNWATAWSGASLLGAQYVPFTTQIGGSYLRYAWTGGGGGGGNEIFELQVFALPEPATFGLLALGGLALLRPRRR